MVVESLAAQFSKQFMFLRKPVKNCRNSGPGSPGARALPQNRDNVPKTEENFCVKILINEYEIVFIFFDLELCALYAT